MQLIPTVDAAEAAHRFPPVRVGDRFLGEDEIAAEMQYHPAGELDEAWREAARSLVIRRLLLDDAERRGIEGPTEEETLARLIEQAVEVPEPDEASCRRYFEANRSLFASPTLLAVSHILLSAAPDDTAARLNQEELGNALLDELTRGAPFEALARRHSVCESRHQGGSLGQISRGQTVEEFERVVWRLPEGLHDQLVETRYGWHVVRVDRRMEGQPLSYDMARLTIRQYLFEKVTRRALRQYIQVLAMDWGVEGVDLDLPDSPLMQ